MFFIPIAMFFIPISIPIDPDHLYIIHFIYFPERQLASWYFIYHFNNFLNCLFRAYFLITNDLIVEFAITTIMFVSMILASTNLETMLIFNVELFTIKVNSLN